MTLMRQITEIKVCESSIQRSLQREPRSEGESRDGCESNFVRVQALE